jgi:hypothetical protein
VAGIRRRVSSGEAPHRLGQLVDREGLAQGGVGPRDLVVAELGRARDQRDRNRRASRAELVDQVAAALAADADVEQGERHVVGGEQAPRLGERPRLEHLEALELEVDPAKKPDRGLVVHDEHPRHASRLRHAGEPTRTAGAERPV